MGFELFRGALYAAFIDKDRKTRSHYSVRLKSLGVSTSEMSVIRGAHLAESSQLFGGPDVVFSILLPLRREVVSKLLKDLTQAGSLTEDAVVVYEHEHKSDSVSLDNFELSARVKRYGIAPS